MSISQLKIITVGIITVLVIGLIDYLVTIDMSLSICYLIPICLVTRYVGRNPGILLSVASGVIWYIDEYTAKKDLNTLLLLWNTIVVFIVFLTVVLLLSAVRDAYEREKNLARTDGLTKICNRRYFLEILRVESKRALRYERCLTLVYVDVDNFKTVNDRFGHVRGDELLCLIADTVSNNLRETDICARLGGDEFAILLPETNYESAQLVLRRIHQKLNQAITEYSFGVGFSIGAITFLELPESIENMLEGVDRLMYQVKNNGKNGLKHQLLSAGQQLVKLKSISD